MRVECPNCRHTAQVQSLRLRGTHLAWTCPACGRSVSIPVEQESPDEHPPEPSERPTGGDSEARCPKCGAPRTDRPDCPRCGLVYENWSEDLLDLPGELADAWETLSERYHDPEAHEAFVALARRLLRLDAAALFYRRRLERNPEDTIARTRLDAIARLVEAEALRPSGRPTRRSRLARTLLWGLVLLGLALLLYLLLTTTPATRPTTEETGPGPGVQLRNEAVPRVQPH